MNRRSLSIVFFVMCLALGGGVLHAQEGKTPTNVTLEPSSSNPVIPRGVEGEWDAGFTYGGQVIYHAGLFHMFYAGGADFSIQPSAIGYATSEDGLTWTKYEGNPILELDPARAANGIRMAVPVVDGNTWILYLNPHERYDVADQSLSILRATASSPEGPWTIDDQPIMEAEGGRDWDGHLVAANAVLKVDQEYILYYDAYGSFGAVGRATSTDGITWTKYDDPETTKAQFRASDPVFVGTESGAWDGGDNIDPAAVRLGDNGWEMFYTGWGASWFDYFGSGGTCDEIPAGIGFAYSGDGIHWTRYGTAPLLPCEGTMVPQVSSIVVVDGRYYLYYSIFNTYPAQSEIGVATVTIDWN